MKPGIEVLQSIEELEPSYLESARRSGGYERAERRALQELERPAAPTTCRPCAATMNSSGRYRLPPACTVGGGDSSEGLAGGGA